MLLCILTPSHQGLSTCHWIILTTTFQVNALMQNIHRLATFISMFTQGRTRRSWHLLLLQDILWTFIISRVCLETHNNHPNVTNLPKINTDSPWNSYSYFCLAGSFQIHIDFSFRWWAAKLPLSHVLLAHLINGGIYSHAGPFIFSNPPGKHEDVDGCAKLVSQGCHAVHAEM